MSRFSFCFYFNVTRRVGLRCLWTVALEFMNRECLGVMAWVRLGDVTPTQGFSIIIYVRKIN